jgi:hypothetical protein
METLKPIIDQILIIVLAVVSGSVPFIVRYALRHVERRLDFDIATKDEERLEALVVEGVHFIEEEYRGKKEKGMIKQNAAVKHIMDAIKDSDLPDMAEAWVVAKVKAKLGQHRHETGSVK